MERFVDLQRAVSGVKKNASKISKHLDRLVFTTEDAVAVVVAEAEADEVEEEVSIEVEEEEALAINRQLPPLLNRCTMFS